MQRQPARRTRRPNTGRKTGKRNKAKTDTNTSTRSTSAVVHHPPTAVTAVIPARVAAAATATAARQVLIQVRDARRGTRSTSGSTEHRTAAAMAVTITHLVTHTKRESTEGAASPSKPPMSGETSLAVLHLQTSLSREVYHSSLYLKGGHQCSLDSCRCCESAPWLCMISYQSVFASALLLLIKL